MDISDDGQSLDPRWIGVSNNIAGVVQDCPDGSAVAAAFVRAGWSSRSSSWSGYEVETGWAQIELDPVEGREVLLNGVVAPQRLDDLASVLRRLSHGFVLELYDDSGALVQEIRA
ncbi:hypothetical protein G6045_26545 [Streptomyces sp. YC504]|uniref:Uncharacterized protein n=1 Tax=Streptomyces mesophilus TaxID=1775132 RepID=A0A6G4XR55_9ACTN|nr:hypothetical protein [Streptomyces mesophilus]NGO79184.1 hypothetical protein [Streptomyces mesophilus]